MVFSVVDAGQGAIVYSDTTTATDPTSAKTLIVGTDIPGAIEVYYIRMEWTTNATVGNREPFVEVRSSAGDVISQITAGPVIAASQTGVALELYPGAVSGEITVGTTTIRYDPMPLIRLQAGMRLVFLDRAAIDAVDPGDEVVVHFMARHVS
jgi:hypothetical protein